MGYKAYPEYKESGVEWLGKVPADWEVQRLKFVASHNDETLPENTDDQYVIEYVDISSVDLVQGITSTECMPFEKAPSRARRVVKHGDTLVSTVRTYLKAIATISTPPENLIVSTGFAVIRAGDEIDAGFLSYYLQSEGFVNAVVANSIGVSYPAINVSDLVCLPTTYPTDKREQANIAQFLDHKTAQVDRLIEKKQKFIGKLQEQRRAFITHAVTSGIENRMVIKDSGIEWLGAVPAHWKTSKLKFESTIVDCKNRTPEYFPDGEYLVVRTSNVRNGELLTEPALHTDQENFEEWTKRGIPPAGSILFTREAPAGEVCLVPAEIKLCLGQRMMNFIIDDHAMTEFILYFLMSNKFQQYIEAESSGSTVTHLRVEQVHNIPVCLPESREAEKIVSKIKCIEGRCFSLMQHAEAAMARLQEYRTALITAAVTGQIDVRDWQAPEPSKQPEADKEVA